MGDRLRRNVSTVHISLDFPNPLPVATSPPAMGYIGRARPNAATSPHPGTAGVALAR
jgi:hypothetical protein